MRSLLILLLLAGNLAPRILQAQSGTSAIQDTDAETQAAPGPQPGSEAARTETDVAGEEATASDDRVKQQQKQKVEIGLILTSVIVIIGVFLVVLTLLYGRRTKRQLAAGRGPSSPRDDLWYLKKSRNTSSQNVPDAEQEGNSE